MPGLLGGDGCCITGGKLCNRLQTDTLKTHGSWHLIVFNTPVHFTSTKMNCIFIIINYTDYGTSLFPDSAVGFVVNYMLLSPFVFQSSMYHQGIDTLTSAQKLQLAVPSFC